MPNKLGILVVERNPKHREGLLKLFRLAGYRVFGAASRKEADSLLGKRSQIDAIVADYEPEGNGGRLLKVWLSRRPETHVIFVTDVDSVAVAVGMMKAGATDYLVKPVSPEKLLEVVGSALGDSGSLHA